MDRLQTVHSEPFAAEARFEPTVMKLNEPAASPLLILITWTVLLVIVAVGELLPANTAPMRTLSALNVNDKILHIGAYAMVALVPAARLRWVLALFCLGTTGCIGLVLEFLQQVVPGRSFDPKDVLANTIGILAGGGAGLWIRQTFE
jgi:VanZ family protein